MGGMSDQDLLAATGGTKPAARTLAGPVHRKTSAGRQLRSGRIMEIRGNDVYVEFGPKSQGICPLNHFPEPPTAGVEMDFVVERLDPFEGLLILAREGAASKAPWGDLKVGHIVEARCVGMNPGGLDMEVAHHHAFMPASQVDVRHVEDISVFLGQKIECEIVELRRNKERMLLSRRRVLERRRAEQRDELLRAIEVGSERTATIVSLQTFGAFADLGGVDGLIPISELAHGMVAKAADVVQVGETIQVRVLRVDKDAKPPRITLSRKQTMTNPVIEAIGTITVGGTVTGAVKRITSFGAFIEVAPGIEGLVHISEISHERLPSPEKALKIGLEVTAKVLSTDAQRGRVSLSIKALIDAPVRSSGGGGERDGRGRGRGDGFGGRDAIEPREADPEMRKLLAKFGSSKRELKGGLGSR
jgi:small subunit ribosomal protein S1